MQKSFKSKGDSNHDEDEVEIEYKDEPDYATD